MRPGRRIVRRRRVARAAAVGGAAYYAGKRAGAGQDAGPEEEAVPQAPAAAAADDPVEQLQLLAELREKGVVTEDEFAAEKRRILGS